MADQNPYRFTFFLPQARVLRDDEVAQLSIDKRKAVEAGERAGLWLELSYPEAFKRDAKGRLVLPVAEPDADKKGTFVQLFCPNDSCRITEPTDLP